MPLSEDQRALLQILSGGDGYEEVASLLGTSAEDVRERAGEAVAELERSGEDAALAEAARQRIQELEGGPAPEAPVTARRAPPRPVWIAIAGVLVVLAAAIGVVLLGSGSDESTPAPERDQEDVIEVKLDPVGGSGATGTAAIVRVADRPAVDVDVSGLEPTGRGEAYVLWVLGSGDKGLPIAFRAVGEDGRFVGRTQIPVAASGLLPNIDTIDLALADEGEVGRAVSQAAQNGTLPNHIGKSVVRGRLPG